MKPESNARTAVRYLLALALHLTGCYWWAERQIRHKGGLVVLAFHRVLTDEEIGSTNSLPNILVSRKCFRQMLGYLQNHYVPTRLSEAKPGHRTSKVGVVLTFDDGWGDNYTNAYPEAVGAGCSFTVMVCPGLVGVESPFWPERATGVLRRQHPGCSVDFLEKRLGHLKKMAETEREAWLLSKEQAPRSLTPDADGRCGSTLNWGEIAEMRAQGIEFGAHTQTHQILDTIEPARVAAEVSLSRQSLERQIQTACIAFAYPNGNVTPEIRRIVEAEGFTYAFTTAPGVWSEETDRFLIPRLNVSESNVTGLGGRFSPTMFRYKVIWKAWRAWRRSKARAGSADLAVESA